MKEYQGNYMEREPPFLVSRRMMDDISEEGHGRIDTATPTLGFPLGTALILFVVFGISALFSCCYHWEKIRNMHTHHYHHRTRTSNTTAHPSPPPPTDGRANFVPNANANLSYPSKHTRFQQQQQQGRSSVPVVMPGDDVAKFIACPSPHGFAPLNISDMVSSQTNKSR